MEKNKSVLIASISGIVACLVCIGMVYLFTPKGSNNLKNNTENVNQEEEILLGDSCSTSSSCSSGKLFNGKCYTQYEPLNYAGCMQYGGSGYDNASGTCLYGSGTEPETVTVCTSCDSGKYLADRKCNTCPSGYRDGSDNGGKGGITSCYKNVGAGYYIETARGFSKSCDKGYFSKAHKVYYGSTSSCTACAIGYYASNVGSSSCTKCEAGFTTTGTGSTSSSQCSVTVACSKLSQSDCNAVENKWDRCVWNSDDGGSCEPKSTSPSTPTPTATPTPTPTPTGESPSCGVPCCIHGSTSTSASACSATMPAGQRTCGECGYEPPTPTPSSSTSCTVLFKTANGSSVIARCPNSVNGSISRTCIPTNTCVSWSTTPCNGTNCSNQSAIGYDNIINNKCNTLVYYCLGGSSVHPTATPKPTPTPTPVIYKCYLDSDNNYHWTSKPESSWKIAKDSDGNEITNKDLCPPKDACYIDTNGVYKWGEYSAKPGYTYVSEITDEDSCKNDETYACYKMDSEYSCFNKDDSYVLAKTAPEGYTKVDDKSLCGKEYIWSKEDKEGYAKTTLSYNQCENPACYYNEKDKKRVWGNYSKVNGYYMLVDENDVPLTKEQCRNDMCYKDPNGEYVWGDYENEEGFTPQPTVDISKCGPDVPTPKTDINVSRMVYIFMAVLMAVGIGFIYYSTIAKKEN